MESSESYYRRRATQELIAARTAVTEGAKLRRRMLAESYIKQLAALTGSDETLLMSHALAPHGQEYA